MESAEKNQKNDQDLTRKNARAGLMVVGIVIAMTALSFAAVPMYSLFCRVTGFGGTTQTGRNLPDTVLDRVVTVNFNTDMRGLNWTFEPELRSIDVQLGAQGLISFHATNTSDHTITGTALYNVTPLKVGKYFNKIQCFCFDEQKLKPHEEASMPVLFYVDPAMNDDPNMDDVSTITLSYTFYESGSKALEDGLEDFYNKPVN